MEGKTSPLKLKTLVKANYSTPPKNINKKLDIFWTNKEKALYLYNYSIKKWFTKEQALRIIAQVHQENWRWHVYTKWDGWCSRWLIQWNVCARGNPPEHFSTWQWQLEMIVDEIASRYTPTKKTMDDFYRAQVAWNRPRVMQEQSYKTAYYYQITASYKRLWFTK